MNNEFLTRKTVKMAITLANASAATTHSSGVFIPAGAIIAGVWLEATGNPTLTACSATILPRIGSWAPIAAIAASALPAQTVAATKAVATTRVPATGELVVLEQASSANAITGDATYNFYIDYIYAN